MKEAAIDPMSERTVSLTPGKRVLFLTKDPELIRRQLGERGPGGVDSTGRAHQSAREICIRGWIESRAAAGKLHVEPMI